jgi:hypothetical protein
MAQLTGKETELDNSQRIKAIDPPTARGKEKELLDAVVKKYGDARNSFKTMAHSPAGHQGFLDLSGTLEGASCRSRLDTKLR